MAVIHSGSYTPTAGDFARALERTNNTKETVVESTAHKRTLGDIEEEYERVRREINDLQETVHRSQIALELRQDVLSRIEKELREYFNRLLTGETE